MPENVKVELDKENEDFHIYVRVNGAIFVITAWLCGFLQGIILYWMVK